MAIEVVVTLNRFAQLAAAVEATVNRALDAGVNTCIAVADPITPVDTGALQGNKSISKGSGERTITWNQHYAAYVEFGTYKMSGSGFAEDGMAAALPVIQAELGRWPG